MEQFRSEECTINASAKTVYDKFSNLENLRSLLEKVPEDKIPEDKREMFNNISVTPDSISFPAPSIGAITLRVTERVEPTLIEMTGEGTPVKLSLSLNISPVSEDSCKAFVQILIDIPKIIRPMISGPLQKFVDQFASVLTAIPFN